MSNIYQIYADKANYHENKSRIVPEEVKTRSSKIFSQSAPSEYESR